MWVQCEDTHYESQMVQWVSGEPIVSIFCAHLLPFGDYHKHWRSMIPQQRLMFDEPVAPVGWWFGCLGSFTSLLSWKDPLGWDIVRTTPLGWGGWGSYGIDSPRKSPKKPESWRCNAVSRWWKRTSSGGSTTTQMWQSWPPPWNRLSILPTFSASRTGTCSQRRSWKLWLCREATSTRACPVTRKSWWSTEDHRLFCRWEINGNFPINH